MILLALAETASYTTRSRGTHAPHDHQHHAHNDERKVDCQNYGIAHVGTLPFFSFILKRGLFKVGVESRLLEIPEMELGLLWVSLQM